MPLDALAAPVGVAPERVEHPVFGQAVLCECRKTTGARLCQYGHTGGSLDRYLVPLQYFQHVLGRLLLGQPGHRVLHFSTAFFVDYDGGLEKAMAPHSSTLA